jgi:hypothetical protein
MLSNELMTNKMYNSGRRGMISSRRWYVSSRALRIIDFQNL